MNLDSLKRVQAASKKTTLEEFKAASEEFKTASEVFN
jgi:hypothetical protein